MLVSLAEVLPSAVRKKKAILAFNVFNLETIQAVVRAAAAESAQVIIAVSEKAVRYAGMENLINLIRQEVEHSRITAVLHLDHGQSMRIIDRALEAGFTSIMFDGSKLSFERNLELTSEIVRRAHRRGISCEAELGTIGGQEDQVKSKDIIYTDPDQAEQFCRLTKIDALAAALGTAHGLPVPHEYINFDLLEKIRHRTQVPIVLHGASNLDVRMIKKGIKCGIAKINIDTQLRQVFTKAVRESLTDQKLIDPRVYLDQARVRVAQECRRMIELFQ